MILDLGCGWRKRGGIGLDYGREAYQKKTCLDAQGDGEHLPFRNGVFDKVVNWNMFEHVLNAFIFLKAWLHVLKPLDLLEIFTRNPYHYMWVVLNPSTDGTEHADYTCDHHAIYYTKNLRRMFSKLGVSEFSFGWKVKHSCLTTYPFADLLVLLGIWRRERLYRAYKIVGRKIGN